MFGLESSSSGLAGSETILVLYRAWRDINDGNATSGVKNSIVLKRKRYGVQFFLIQKFKIELLKLNSIHPKMSLNFDYFWSS